MTDLTILEGPVETIDGQLSLRIPLALVDARFVESLHGAAQVDGTHLTLSIPDELARDLALVDGSQVVVDNRGGNFTILPLREASSEQTPAFFRWRVSAHPHAPVLKLGQAAFFAHFDRS